MGKNANNNVIKLWDHEFKGVKPGLDEEQVVSFVNELINERDILVKRQEHLPSFALLAERSVAEADNVARQIRQQAAEQAKDNASAIVAEAKEQAQQMIEEKKTEAIAMVEKEAEAIKADAIKHADQLPEEKTRKIQSELRDTAKRLFGELLSQFESLKQQVTALEANFEKMLSQTTNQTGPTTTEEENKITSGTDSGVSPEVMPGTPAEAM